MTPAWRTMFGVAGDKVVEIAAYPVEGGYIVRRGCWREFVDAHKLFATRIEAEQRLAELGPNGV